MPTYRFYRLDGAGRIAAADWVEADEDEGALASARQRADGSRFELWQHQRLVHREQPRKA